MFFFNLAFFGLVATSTNDCEIIIRKYVPMIDHGFLTKGPQRGFRGSKEVTKVK